MKGGQREEVQDSRKEQWMQRSSRAEARKREKWGQRTVRSWVGSRKRRPKPWPAKPRTVEGGRGSGGDGQEKARNPVVRVWLCPWLGSKPVHTIREVGADGVGSR